VTRVVAEHTTPVEAAHGARTARNYRLALVCYPL
jgi:hypothetical protein